MLGIGIERPSIQPNRSHPHAAFQAMGRISGSRKVGSGGGGLDATRGKLKSGPEYGNIGFGRDRSLGCHDEKNDEPHA
jgi:hypothetical protein